MEIVGTLILMTPAAIVFLILYLRGRAVAERAAEAEVEPTEAEPAEAGPAAGV